MKKTKVIATIGPSSSSEDILRQMIIRGMDIARFNMKYSSHDFCEKIIKKINKINKELNKNVSILFDLEGPDIVIGKLISESVTLNKDDKIRIYIEDIIGDATKFSINYPSLIKDVKSNTIIKIEDSLVELVVLEKSYNYILCQVKKSGEIRENKTLRILDTKVDVDYLTEKDKKDIEFANEMDIDFLSLSLVSSVEDVLKVNDELIKLNNDHMSIITKIENENAIDDIDEILKISDGIKIARGDLSIELPMERVPGLQKMIINKCHNSGKFSIVATEFLSTMQNNTNPTRAEVSDIANAVIDGVDVIQLSGETTIGLYPVLTIETIYKIIETAEYDFNYYEIMDKTIRTENQDITGGVASSVVECSNKLNTNAIVTLTMSGYTAKKISRFRPKNIIIAIAPNIKTVKELNIYYGVYPVLIEEIKSFDKILEKASMIAKEILKQNNGKIIITGGYPFNKVKHTNFMKIEEL